MAGIVKFQRMWNISDIKQVIMHPKIYPHIVDDFMPESWEPPDPAAVWYVGVKDDVGFMGLFILVPQNHVCWEVHTCLLPESWGARAHKAASELPLWVFANTDCKRLVTNVPAYNRLALKFAESAGLRQYGINPQSYQKHGILHDQIMLGISPCHSVH